MEDISRATASFPTRVRVVNEYKAVLCSLYSLVRGRPGNEANPSIHPLMHTRQERIKGKFIYVLLIHVYASINLYFLFCPDIPGLTCCEVSFWEAGRESSRGRATAEGGVAAPGGDPGCPARGGRGGGHT